MASFDITVLCYTYCTVKLIDIASYACGDDSSRPRGSGFGGVGYGMAGRLLWARYIGICVMVCTEHIHDHLRITTPTTYERVVGSVSQLACHNEQCTCRCASPLGP